MTESEKIVALVKKQRDELARLSHDLQIELALARARIADLEGNKQTLDTSE